MLVLPKAFDQEGFRPSLEDAINLYNHGFLAMDQLRGSGYAEEKFPMRSQILDFDDVLRTAHKYNLCPWLVKKNPDFTYGHLTFDRRVMEMEILEEYGFVDLGYPWMFGRTIQPVIMNEERMQLTEPFLVAIPMHTESAFNLHFHRTPSIAGGFSYKGRFEIHELDKEFKVIAKIPTDVRCVAVCNASYPDETGTPKGLELPVRLKVTTPFLRALDS